jgi:hypothetical protein
VLIIGSASALRQLLEPGDTPSEAYLLQVARWENMRRVK